MKKEETKIQEQIVTYLNGLRILNWRMQAQPSQFGLPDVLAVYKGRIVGLEVKTETGKPTELQKRTINAIRNAGGYAGIVRGTSDVAGLLQLIDADIHTETLPE